MKKKAHKKKKKKKKKRGNKKQEGDAALSPTARSGEGPAWFSLSFFFWVLAGALMNQ